MSKKVRDALELILTSMIGVLFFALLCAGVYSFFINLPNYSKWINSGNESAACTCCCNEEAA